MNTRVNDKTEEKRNKQFDQCIKYHEEARKKFLKLEGVIGVGYGPKEKDGHILDDETSIIVYVEKKKKDKSVNSKEYIPESYKGIPTDVVVPGQRSDSHLNADDSMWLEWGKIHESNPQKDVNLEPKVDFDLDHVSLVEIDDTFVTNNKIDWPKATKRFLNSHPDVFDFITFYVDTSSGLPNQGSFHSGIYNKTMGLNYYAGDNLDRRAQFGSNKLQAFLSLGWFGNYVLLQEFGHMWGAFVRNRDSVNAANRYDLLIGPTGQGKFHWGRFFDNDHSPMDYDGIDWQALGGNQFKSHGIADDYFHFHPLDLYLMGLISPNSVGSFYTIQNPSANSGTITGSRKNMSVKNVIWAEGKRNPAYPNSQKIWKQAFVVLTKDAHASRTFAERVVRQRREFSWQAYKATRFLGKVDTTLRSNISFPKIRDISMSIDNDRAIIGWKTNVSTKGSVNFSTSPNAFKRDRTHTEPFTTVSTLGFSNSHGVQLTGLNPDTTYYFEIVVENKDGLYDRKGIEKLYTRRTNDTCSPDINNVKIRRIKVSGGYKVTLSWKTNELANGRIFFGTSTPPAQTRFDPYPTTNHLMFLTGLSAGTYYFSIESRDAAGNVTRDDNRGNYYRVVIPANLIVGLKGMNVNEINERIDVINSAFEVGNTSNSIYQASELIAEVATRELDEIIQMNELPDDKLEAGYQSIELLLERLDSVPRIVEQDKTMIDFAVQPDPLENLHCLALPGDTVATECGHPVLTSIIKKTHPDLTLEPHPTLGMGYYRLKQN